MAEPTAPKVSILVPIFNVEKYLNECLDSIVAQTLEDIEIICINDGSTDSSPKIIKEYARKDSRFVIINKKNSGYGDSMNRGLKKAKGKYIGIVESDDFIEPTMFEDLFTLAETNNAEVVKSNFWYYYEHLDEKSPQWSDTYGAVYSKERRKIVTEHNTKAELIRKEEVGRVIDPRTDQAIFYQKPSIWSALYRKDFIENNDIRFLPTAGASYQDTGFSFKVWALCRRATYTDKAYLHYRQDNEASSVNSPGKVFCVADEYREIESFLVENNLTEELGPLAQKTKYGAYHWNFNRLKDGLDAEFITLFSKEYKESYESGLLDFSFFGYDEQEEILDLIHAPELYLNRKRAKENAKVSVIVPVYNTAEYLVKCLDSITSQTLKDIEIICVNDGSTDGSMDILNEYRKKDPRVIVATKQNSGPSATRNRGIAMSNSDFLVFCDSDDYLEVDACEKLYGAITTHDADIALGELNIVYTTSQAKAHYLRTDRGYYSLKYKGKVDITDSLILKSDVSPCGKIFRKSVQLSNGVWYPNGMWYEDANFFTTFMSVSKTAYFLKNEYVYNYVRHDNGIMASTSKKTPRAIDHLRVWGVLFTFMKRRDIVKDHKELLLNSFKGFYSFASRNTPIEFQKDLQKELKKIYASTKDYLQAEYPELADEIDSAVNYGITKELSIAARIKKRARGLVRKTSVRYRREQYIIDRISTLEDRIMAIGYENTNQLSDINQTLEGIKKNMRK